MLVRVIGNFVLSLQRNFLASNHLVFSLDFFRGGGGGGKPILCKFLSLC